MTSKTERENNFFLIKKKKKKAQDWKNTKIDTKTDNKYDSHDNNDNSNITYSLSQEKNYNSATYATGYSCRRISILLSFFLIFFFSIRLMTEWQ